MNNKEFSIELDFKIPEKKEFKFSEWEKELKNKINQLEYDLYIASFRKDEDVIL